MTQSDKKVEMWCVLNHAMDEVARLKKAASSGPPEEMLDNFDKLIATLMTIREVAGELAELDSERAVVMWVLQDSVTREILRLTSCEAKSATAGV